MNEHGNPSWTLGRGADCELRFDHDTVSRRHARLAVDSQGQWTLEDLDSSNGTWRREEDAWVRVRLVQIALDDALRLGERETSLRQLLERFSDVIVLADLDVPLTEGVLRVAAASSDDPRFERPRRNPRTGEIEDSQ
ncbi:MAG: FHA domain-containing protein [Xanthomonadales bacterium]|jgi:pSer/pThr/pTyr-binding forkhead associated (FHA) protein|nr:FHA domain-containing protein [Xanthomonadales bacterium]